MSDFSSPPSGTSAGDAELQEFLLVEKQKAQVNAQVSIFITVIVVSISFFNKEVCL